MKVCMYVFRWHVHWGHCGVWVCNMTHINWIIWMFFFLVFRGLIYCRTCRNSDVTISSDCPITLPEVNKWSNFAWRSNQWETNTGNLSEFSRVIGLEQLTGQDNSDICLTWLEMNHCLSHSVDFDYLDALVRILEFRCLMFVCKFQLGIVPKINCANN